MPRPAELILAGTDEQSMEPRAKSIGITQTTEVAPRAHEGLLRGVIGRCRPMEDEACRTDQAPELRPRQDGERLPVPMLRSDNQLAAHATINSVDVPARTSTQTQASTEVGPVPSSSAAPGEASLRTGEALRSLR